MNDRDKAAAAAENWRRWEAALSEEPDALDQRAYAVLGGSGAPTETQAQRWLNWHRDVMHKRRRVQDQLDLTSAHATNGAPIELASRFSGAYAWKPSCSAIELIEKIRRKMLDLEVAQRLAYELLELEARSPMEIEKREPTRAKLHWVARPDDQDTMVLMDGDRMVGKVECKGDARRDFWAAWIGDDSRSGNIVELETEYRTPDDARHAVVAKAKELGLSIMEETA